MRPGYRITTYNDTTTAGVPRVQTALLLIAHGSREPAANADLQHIAANLRARLSLKKRKSSEQHASVNCQPAEKRNWLQMNFTRTRKIDHSDAQGQRSEGYRKHQGRKQCDEKCEKTCSHLSSTY